MSLRIQLSLEDTELLYQQNVYMTIFLKNVGANPLSVDVPAMDENNPVVHLTNIQTGVEDTIQHFASARAADMAPGQLPPGEVAQAGFYLLDYAPELEPGFYDVCVSWFYENGQKQAKSNSIRIKILPDTPKNMTMANAVGGQGEIKYAAWINLAGDPNLPPDIVRGRFTFKKGGGVSEVQKVTAANVQSIPVLSSPMVGNVAASQWVAWLGNGSLNYCHVDDELGVSEIANVPVAFEELEIIPPIYSAEVEDTTVRPLGGVLLQHPQPGGSEFRLDTVQLAADEAKSLGHLIVAGDKPVWAMSHVRSSQQWLVTYLQEQQSGLLLSYCPWPGFPTENPAPVNLALWKSQFIAANATVAADDTIHGGILMWKKPKEKPRRLVLETWTLVGDNINTQEHPLDWPPNQLIKDARVGVSDTGLLVALLADEEGNWFVTVNGGEFQPLPVEIQKTRQVLDIAFMEGEGDPLLVCGNISRGFNILQLDGMPLPPKEPK